MLGTRLTRLVFLTLGLALGTFLVFRGLLGSLPEQAATTASKGHHTAVLTDQAKLEHFRFKRIEDVRVGDRVIAENPDRPDEQRSTGTRVDSATWKKVRLYAESVWDDGTVDDIHIETLQPPEWLEANQVRVGSNVTMPLDLVEMGLPTNLTTTVVAIEPCPSISQGAGQVVLTTVNHLNEYVFDLTVTDQNGREETIGVTGFHKIYSASRKTWASASELRIGEELVGTDGLTISVVKTVKRPTTHRVYNMTVEAEHVYHVSLLGMLVHNNGCNPSDTLIIGSGAHPANSLTHPRPQPGNVTLDIDPDNLPTHLGDVTSPDGLGVPGQFGMVYLDGLPGDVMSNPNTIGNSVAAVRPGGSITISWGGRDAPTPDSIIGALGESGLEVQFFSTRPFGFNGQWIVSATKQ